MCVLCVMCVWCVYDIVRNLSVITAVEESNGRDSSVVRRPIEIVSNLTHNLVCVCLCVCVQSRKAKHSAAASTTLDATVIDVVNPCTTK